MQIVGVIAAPTVESVRSSTTTICQSKLRSRNVCEMIGEARGDYVTLGIGDQS